MTLALTQISLLEYVSDRFVFYLDGRLWFRNGPHESEEIDLRRQMVSRSEAYKHWPAPRGRVNTVDVVKGVVYLKNGSDGSVVQVDPDRVNDPLWHHEDVAWMYVDPASSRSRRLTSYATPRREFYTRWRSFLSTKSSWQLLDDKVTHDFTEPTRAMQQRAGKPFSDIIQFYNWGSPHIVAPGEPEPELWQLSPIWNFTDPDDAEAHARFRLPEDGLTRSFD